MNVASFHCLPCGALDEVREPCPEQIPCWGCKRTMARYRPAFTPPAVAGRDWR